MKSELADPHLHKPAHPPQVHIGPTGPLLDVPVNTPRWMHYGDMIRILGTIAVVIGHVSDMGMAKEKPLSLNWWVCNIWDAATRWAVPAYIMLSGALLLDPARGEGPSKFYHKRLMRIGVPLAFWSVFFLWFGVYYTRWVPLSAVPILLLKGQPYAHLHFIFRIAGLYAFTPMIRVFLRHTTRSMLVGTVILLLCFSSADSLANGITGTELSAFARFAPFVGYYLCGYLLRETLVSGWKLFWCWVGSIGTVAILAFGTGALVNHFGMKWYPSPSMILYDFLSPVRVVMAVCSWLILVRLFHNSWPRSKRGQAIVRAWANTTLGLYLIHPMFREMLYVGRIGLDGHWHIALPSVIAQNWVAWPNIWIGVPVISAMVYIPALISTIILMKIPYVRRIAG